MDHPMPSGLGTITLPTADHGDVTLPEPSWCAGHAHHDPLTERVDLTHSGPDAVLTFRGQPLSVASLAQHPLAEEASREPYASDLLYGRPLDARGLYAYAAAVEAYAGRLRALADQLLVILAGEDQ
ncbi:DUF6907 domain-containing protein [Streptomyces sp. NPDC057148]|uniref:DUF6907 domain-containing protein n=1 Tax=unclassified Streptomyces TaxID=2593676 RepID=UPI003634EFB1